MHALVWIIVTITVVVVMMSLLDTFIDTNFNQNYIKSGRNCEHMRTNKEGYWPVPYFMGEYTQNDKERYFDYMPFPSIHRKIVYNNLS